ncbi:prolipoprotein diacylglyceryl transferase [Gammaproteobacteria bacterium]|jgi:phosphatidylglycerol:prolipoprotein diacylglycerol transferase|nr:prolipoprotein diacylglyceryl transferase [Gammaproteobacteria bacterium]
MLVYPEIDPVIFTIGFVKIRWYGLMYVIGFVLAWWLARRRCHRDDSPVDPTQVDDLIFYAMLGVIVGGRVGYCLVYGWDQLISDPLYLFKITEGGMSFHGGLVGVMTAMWLYGRSLGKTIWHITDFVAPLVPLGLGFGRIGNFINGELWGKPTDVPWGVLYRGQVLHPSQIYEALLEGLLLFVLLWWYSSRPRPYMAVSGAFLFLYGLFRFFVEFYRVPDEDLGYLALSWVTMGQILSAPMILAGGIMVVMAYRSHRAKEAAA